MKRFRKHITHVSNIRDAVKLQNEPTRLPKLHDFVYMASSYPFTIFSSPNPEIYLLLSISIHSQSTSILLLAFPTSSINPQSSFFAFLTLSACPSPLFSPLPITLIGPLLTIKLMTSNNVSAAAMVVCSALVSYAGATSTISAATKLMPSSPRMIVRSSRVLQPPVSGVPVAGATRRGCKSGNAFEEIQEEAWRELTCRIQGINVDGKIHRLFCSHPIPDFLDNSLRTNHINFPCLHNLKSAIAVMIIVAHPTQRRANTRMDVAIVGQQSLLVCMVKICTVVDGSLFARCAAEDFWAPGI